MVYYYTRIVENLFKRKIYGNILCQKARFSHGGRRVGYSAVARIYLYFVYSELCLNFYCVPALSVTVVIGVLCNAADTVTRHLAFGAVRVEDSHLHVGNLRLLKEDDSVCSYSEMPVAERNAERFRTGYPAVKVLYEYIVVTCRLHL